MPRFQQRFILSLLTWVYLAVGIVACSKRNSSSLTDNFPRVIGERGQTTGRFSYPRGIDVAQDGRVAVIDKTGRVQIFNPAGDVLREWRLPKMDNGTPTGLLFDATDPTTTTLLIADTHNARVLRCTVEGQILKTFGEYGSAPGQMIYPTNVTLDEKGNIYVTEYGERDRVLKFNRDGDFIKEWGSFGQEPGQFQRPLALLWMPPDKIIVADSCNHRLQIFTTEGELLSVWGEVGREPGQLNYPYDLALGSDGLLYVCEFGNNRIQSFDLKGNPQGIYGHAGIQAGEFGTPWGLAFAPNGDLYVADTNNHRVQVVKTKWFKDAVPAERVHK